MKREKFIDDFFLDQPERLFTEELCKYEVGRIYKNEGEPCANAVRVSGISLEKGDFAVFDTLDTVYQDLDRFMEYNGLEKVGYPVKLAVAPFATAEEYEIEIGAEACLILAADTEGIRRAVMRLEELLILGGGDLTVGKTHAVPVLKRRLTRCFFSPTNRPPKNGDELFDDIDYYPEAYLNRLMHDGINAIWIYTSFEALVKTSYIPEYGEGGEKRLKKLNRVIEKCKRYGIEVFIFAMEPVSLDGASIGAKYPGLIKKYPEALGAKSGMGGPTAFCSYTDFARGYVEEAIKKIFEAAPGLGGLLSITQGERVTTCSNTWGDYEGVWKNDCPHCSDKRRAEILTHTIGLVRGAIDKVKPEAEYISWTYGHRGWRDDEIEEYVRCAPERISLLQNFEDAGREMQLGKKRVAFDYWLSYKGPSHMFRFTAEKGRLNNKPIYAKLQVCCSHECASVPYIPVPGIIYDKITSAIELGVTGVMESWYFGNYPCIMSRAVELLAYGNRFKSKREFLLELATLVFPRCDAEKLASAWEAFEEGYVNYPINVMFGYYGPMTDGIVWELALIPKNFSLSRSWQLIDKTDGDRIGECLFNGHTIREAVTLAERMCEAWERGCAFLSETSVAKSGVPSGEITVAEALRLLFKSGRNVLRFYELRNKLGYGEGDAETILAEIRAILDEELLSCERMIELCKKDTRLGYHSEAEGYKFFPKKLEYKIEKLRELIAGEFEVVKERVALGLSPLPYFDGEDPDSIHYKAARGDISLAEWADVGGKGRFRVAVGDENIKIELSSDKKAEFVIANEFNLFFPAASVIIKKDGNLVLHRDCKSHQSYFDENIDEELNKWHIEKLPSDGGSHYLITFNKKDMGFVRLPYKMMITADGERWCPDENPVEVLGKKTISPESFGWIE